MLEKNQEKVISRLEKENNRLKNSLQELSLLNEISIAIGSTNALDKIIELIIQKCVKYFQVEQAVVMLLDPQKTTPFHTVVRSADESMISLPYRLDSQLTGWMLLNNKPLLVNDLYSDKRFSLSKNDDIGIKSLLCAPLMLKGKMIGLISLFNKKKEEFTENNQRLLSIIASESAQILENARLLKEEQAYQAVRAELEVAKNIQQKLLPEELPKMDGFEIAAVNIPANEVSGDYYDLIEINKQKFALGLGDISGKGMPAALLMANLQATLRGQVIFNDLAKDCINYANTLLFKSTESNKFATLFFTLVDIENKVLSCCNAGHDQPILLKKSGDIIRLKTGGIPLGFMQDFVFEEESIVMEPGDTLIMYSDGITEAMDEEGQEYSEEKLLALCNEFSYLSADEIKKRIVSAVHSHARNVPQSDDMTLLILKRIH
jgi:sigma-B regulation protein RsbU (phosphoserine phosphatase)